MKSLKLMLAALIAVFFTACIQIEEEVELNADGSGQITMQTDMGEMFQMLKGFASEEDLKKDGMDRAVDTLVNLKDLIDSSNELTSEQKNLLRDATLKMRMNMKENIFNLNMRYPFKNTESANRLFSTINESGVMGNALKGLNPAGGADAPAPGAGGPGFDKVGGVYDVELGNGQYKRSLNRARYDSLVNDPKFKESSMMLSAMGEMNMNLTVKLPRKVKSVSNPKAVISGDKRTVTLKGSVNTAIQKPEEMEILIKY